VNEEQIERAVSHMGILFADAYNVPYGGRNSNTITDNISQMGAERECERAHAHFMCVRADFCPNGQLPIENTRCETDAQCPQDAYCPAQLGACCRRPTMREWLHRVVAHTPCRHLSRQYARTDGSVRFGRAVSVWLLLSAVGRLVLRAATTATT
jgi:hypothetical protein